MIRALALILLLAGPAAAQWAPGFAPETRPMVFAAPEGGPLAFRGALAIRPEGGVPAGLSGVVMEDGRTALAISDKGYWARLRLRIEDGWLTGVDRVETAPILGPDGVAVDGDLVDAEGLARDPATGRLWVSFEKVHRIWRFPAAGAPAEAEIRRDDWAAFTKNGGLEGLALDPRGQLWAMRETSGDAATPYPAWVFGGGTERRSIPRGQPHGLTGADFGPDGRLYLTHRDFSFSSGFRVRLRRIPAEGRVETLLDLPSESLIDNIEAVTLWRETGRVFLLLLSDDNAFPFQRNVVALFEVLD